VSSSDKALNSQLKEDKFIKEHNNIFFKNENGELMFINRSLVDRSLDIRNLSEEAEESKT